MAGKSNVMDAISFVFGHQAYDLRGRKAQDLIYKSPLSDETSAPDSASVELVYTELENGTEHSFKRTIRRTSSTITHYVDGKRVTAQQYHDELKTIGVDSKSPNFLVYQGDVELIAQKKWQAISRMVGASVWVDTIQRRIQSEKCRKRRGPKGHGFVRGKRKKSHQRKSEHETTKRRSESI